MWSRPIRVNDSEEALPIFLVDTEGMGIHPMANALYFFFIANILLCNLSVRVLLIRSVQGFYASNVSDVYDAKVPLLNFKKIIICYHSRNEFHLLLSKPPLKIG